MLNKIKGERKCEGCGGLFVMKPDQTLCKACQKEGPKLPTEHNAEDYLFQSISRTELDKKLDIILDKVNRVLTMLGSSAAMDKPKGYTKTCEKCQETFFAAAPATRYCPKCGGKG